LEVFLYDGLHDAAVHVGEPDAHHGAKDEQNGEEGELLDLGAAPRGDHVLNQFPHALPENAINVSSAFALLQNNMAALILRLRSKNLHCACCLCC